MRNFASESSGSLLRSFLFWLGSMLILNGQNQLPAEKKNLLKKQLGRTEEILRKSLSDQASAWKNIQILQKQVANRTELLGTINLDLAELQKELAKLQSEHRESLEKLDRLKEEYYAILRKKWMYQQSVNPSYGVSGASDLQPIVLHQVWTEQLNRERKRKYEEFRKSQLSVLERRKEIERRIEEQKNLLSSKDSEILKLQKDLEEQKRLVSSSESKQKDYLNQIRHYESEMNKLESIINSGIKASPPEKISVLENIQSRSAGWTFPLNDGLVITRFGTQSDPNNKNLRIKNNGVDIRSRNQFVSAAKDAEVVQIREMPNGSYIVMTRQADLYMVYSNLRQVLVKPGEKIQAGSHIGTCRPAGDGEHELHFEIWKGKKPEDPVRYIGQ